MADHEDHVAFRRALVAPFEKVRWHGRLAVLVGAEETDVEAEPWKLEVVGVAAEIGDAVLRREDQTDIGVLLVAIKVIQPALVERDHVAAQAGLLGRFLFDPGDDRLGERRRLARRLNPGLTACSTRSVTSIDLLQDVQFQIGTLHFLPARAGQKPSRR